MKGMQKAISKSRLYLKRASPTILTFIGSIGVIGTAVMAVRATPKALMLLEETTDEKGEELSKLEIVRVAWPVYIPATVICLSTICCIFGANILNKRQQATLASAYALLSQSYQKYRKAANSVFGEDADSKIMAEVAKDTYISAEGFSVYDPELDTASEKILFHDAYSCRYFTSTLPAVIQAQYHLNRNFILRGMASVNEFYKFLGIDQIKNGDNIGWGEELLNDNVMWVDFENSHVATDDGLEVYVISALYGPQPF